MVFNNYAKYYDLLYKDKDYKTEIEYIDSLIKKHSGKKNIRVLDIGCGTGKHAAYLAEKGYHVTGIDLSQNMINLANSHRIPNTEFYVQNATSFELEGEFDVILSLFHVVSYQTSNSDIRSMFGQVNKHLAEGGLFIFDFWYGAAVLHEMPSVKVKRWEDESIRVVRIAEPVIHFNRNVVDVNYDLAIYDKSNGQSETVKEKHEMRYLFLPEVDAYLDTAGLRAIQFEEWISGEAPSAGTWGVTCIAVK